MSEIRMLLIDQNGIMTTLDRNGYKKMGVSIKSATNYGQMQKILDSEPIDVIVINYDYAELDTAAVCNHLKSSPATKDIPIVITSVQNIGRTLKKAIKCGFDLFVEQPIPRQYLIEKVRALLDQKTRKTNRVTLKDIPVTLVIEKERSQCAIEDISQTGLLVNTRMNLEMELELELLFSLPGYKRPFKGRGRVVRRITRKNSGQQEDQVGYGILFTSLEGDGQERLDRYIEKCHSDDPKLVYYL